MAAPTFVGNHPATSSTNWSTTTTPKTCTFTPGNGNILALLGCIEDSGSTLSTPTGGLTWALQQANTTASNVANYGWTATGAGASNTPSVARSATVNEYGFDLFEFSGSAGVGASNKATSQTGTHVTLSVTTTAANSALAVMICDWNATPVSSDTYDQVNGASPTVVTSLQVSTHYSIRTFYYADAGAAGSKTVGVTSSQSQKASIIVIEITGASSTNFTQTNTDSTGSTDSVSQLSVDGRSTTDSAGSVDSASQVAAAVRAPADSAGSSDAVGQLLASSQSFSDPANGTDSALQSVASIRVISDDAGSSDTVAQSSSGGGTAYRLWPATSGPGSDAADTSTYTMGMRFVLSAAANLTAVYWWKATATSVPPTLCGVFNDDTGVLVASSETFTDPGAATGWVKQTLTTPVALVAAQAYKVAVYGVALGYSATANYWDTGPGAAGITTGIITAPNNTNAGGQDTFNTSATPMQHPTSSFNAGNYWIDLEVTTSGATNFTQVVADDAGATDTTAQLVTAAQTVTDLTGSTDAASQVAAVTRVFTDGSGSTDSVAQQATNFYAQTFTDSTGSTDSAGQLSAAARAQTDSAGSTDSLTSGVTVPRTFTDDAGSTDLGQTYEADYAETLTDPAGSTDNVTQQSSSTGGQTFTDNAGSTDSIVQQSVSNYTFTITDSTGATDSTATAMARPVTDLTGSTDTTSQVSNQTRTVTDDAGSTDAVNQQSSSAGGQTFTDPTGATDTTSQAAAYVRGLTDDAGVTDAVAQQSSTAGGQTFVDPAGSTDAVMQVVAYRVTVTDSAGSTDTMAQAGSNLYTYVITDDAGSTDVMVQPGQRDIDVVNLRVEPGRLSVSVESGRGSVAAEGNP